MTYNISSSSAPTMSRMGKGTEILKLITTQVAREMKNVIVQTPFPALVSHL